MKELILLINNMTGEERLAFYAFAKARNKRSDVKNIKLFQLIENGVTTDLANRLYGEENHNALYALTKRLRDNLIDFTASHGLETESDEEMQLLKNLLASRIFFEKGLHKLGFKILKKAIQKARKLELYALLNEMYHTLLQHAHKNPSVQLDLVVKEYQSNLKNQLAEADLMTAYAFIKEDLQTGDKDVEEVIDRHLKTYGIKLNAAFGFKSLYTLMTIAVEAATIKNDYYSAAHFMEEAYHIVNTKKELATRHLYYHIAILKLMSMTYFRNKNFDKAREFLRLMWSQLNLENGKYMKIMGDDYHHLKALIEIYTGELLNGIKTLSHINYPTVESELTSVMAHFQNKNYKQCSKIMRDLSHSDDYYEKRIGFNWVVKRNIIEILILIERNQPDLVESRIHSFNKRYRKRLKDKDEVRVLSYLKLLRLYYDAPHQVTTEAFYNKVEKSFDWIGADREDIFVMSFYAWLKAKMQSRPLYEVTLELTNL
ncbi:hypothetical protein BST92_05260 [Nonlabens arenilitoris]|uniref:Uncharacterized protein n=1 Tax=Nonlabens arenilitoris TaxID=1217969 RepID=A0A2S7U9P3_9FLAO|nr:hypothetical protein [Nonlabens arenilitoris]PQJ31367.1 hypothetical protein BST92_05260 [Nonlabens arenilitoris]